MPEIREFIISFVVGYLVFLWWTEPKYKEGVYVPVPTRLCNVFKRAFCFRY